MFPGVIVRIVSEDTKKKIRNSHFGIKPSLETRQKLSKSHLGQIPGNKGKKGLQVGWSKGLTKETHPSVAKISNKMMGNKNGFGPCSIEKAEKISKSKKGKPLTQKHKDALKKAWQDPEVKDKRIQAVLAGKVGFPGFYAEDLGHWVRSGWEANIARLFKYLGYHYEYEKYRFKLSTKEIYVPDFYLPVFDLFIEVKGNFYGEGNLSKPKQFIVEKIKRMRIIDSSLYKKYDEIWRDVIPNWGIKYKSTF